MNDFFDSDSLNQNREGFCKCGNKIKAHVIDWWQIRQGSTYCINCNNFTPTKFLKIIEEKIK